jgi:hypothetical protein
MASIWDDLESQGPSPEKTPVAKAETGGSIWDSLEAPVSDEPKNAPGFISDIKRGTGQVVSSFGSTLQDLGAEGVGESIEKYGKEVVTRNPSQINTVEQAISSPFTTAREAVGEIVPQVGTAVGFGIGGRIIGGALGSFAGPAGTVVGQQVGGVAGAYLGNLAQSYGGIRSEQRESGQNDIARALGSGAVAAGLDTALGAERIATKVLGKGSSFIARESGEKLLPHVLKQGARGFAEEAGTEVLQTGIERFGAFKDLTGDEALNEYGLAAIKGGFGGGAVRGGLSAVAGQRDAGSILGDANNRGTQGTTETNAINTAIDSNSPEVMGPLPEQMGPPELTGPRQIDPSQVPKTPVEQAAEQAAAKQAQEAEALAAEEERLKQLNETRQSVFQKYGGVVQPLGQKSAFNFQGKIYYTQNQLNQALDKLVEAESQKSDVQRIVEDAYAEANRLVGGKMLTPAALQKAVAPYVDQAESKEEILARVELDLQQALQNVKSPQQLAKVEPLHALRDELAGIPVEQRVPTVDLLPKAEPKGKQDERLQLESDAGLRTVSEQGGAVEGDGTRPGILRPSSVQPKQPGSVAQGQTSQQVGAVPAGGVRTSTDVSTTGGPSVQGGQDALQGKGQGQVNVSQVAAQTGRGSVSDQTATRDGTSEEAIEETAEGIVKQVVNSIIDAVVVRKGRMKKADLAKFKDFIYYDFFQIENKKEGKDGLSKKELAQMFEVTPDTIDGWQKNAAAFFEENRGVIQQKILEALAQNNLTLDNLMDAVKARRDKVETEAVILEEGQSLSEVEREDEEAAKSQVKEVAATDQELGTEEGVLDERDLAGDNVGMSVNQGRVQGSIQEQGKPEETINARVKRLLEQYNEAVAEGNEELEAKLMADIDTLTKEAKTIAEKQVRKTEDLAPKKAAAPKKEPKKRKKVKDAVQEPSAEKVPVREGATGSEGVRKEDTEKREVTGKGKAEEAAETLAEKAERLWNEQAAKFDLPVYGSLNEKVQKDWQDSVESGNTKLADMNVVFEANQEAKTVSDTKLDEQIAELPKAQVQALEKYYGVDKDSNEFFDRVKEDVVNYINKGAQAVSGAIRSIIKTISEGVLATALVFNPGTYQGINYDLPAFMKETRTVVAEAPKNVEMSTVAQRTYEVSAPTFAKAKTPFFIADKPNGKIHLFDDTGKHIASSDALYGKTEGDVLTAESRAKKADELADVDKVTPAGTYTITVSQNAEYEGGYTLRLNDKNGDLGGIAIHSVYLGDAKENRPAKLLSKDLKDKKISYGCINTSQDFFVNKILPKIGSFENAGVVVIPDAQDTLMAFLKPTTESKRKEMARGGVATELAAKEETIAVTVDNKAKTPTTRIFANRAIKLFSDLRRVLTREQFDVLNKLDYQTVELDSETKESVEMAFVTLQDLAKFPSIVKALQALKLSPQALLSIDKFAIFKNEGAFEGSDGIQTTYVDENGNLQVVLGMNESGFLSRTDEEITHTFLHETGHGVDLPGYEAGVYSSQPEFRKGGMVREELTKLFKSDEDFAFLAYPLSNKQDEEVTRGELFAQAWAAYLNPDFRAIMEKKAPQTAKYMEDVVNDVKTTTFSRGTPEAAGSQVKEKAKLFADYRGQRLAGTKGEVKINLTPAEKRYVNSDQFQEDVTQFAQDEGFENELLLSDDFFDIDNKANQLTIPGSMVPAMRKFFDWLVYSDAGYLGKIPPRFRSGRTFFNRKQQGNIQKLPKPLQGPVSEITSVINDLARNGLNYWSFTEQLAERASKYIKSAKDYVSLVREQQAVKTRYERRVDLILQQYDKLDVKFRGTGPGSVNAFLKSATMAGKWAFDPGYLKKTPEIDAGLKAQFDAMPKSAQDVIKAVFKHGHDTLQDMKKGVIDNITSEYDALIKAARDSNDIKELALLEKKKAKALKDYSTLMAIQAGKPYAPLKRFGNFVVVAKSDDYLEQEAVIKDSKSTDDEKKEARSKLRELEKSEEHYYVSFAETKREGRKIEEQLRTEGYGYVSEAFEKDSTKTDVYGGRDVQNVFYRLRNLAEDSLDENTGGKSTKAINRLINDLHLTLLAEQSARQSERRRKGVAGAEDDMMRAFATQGMATAHFIATLHNSGKIYDSLQQMRKEADAQTPGRDVRREFYNEFMKRHALGLDYQPNSILNKALGTTSFWMLLTNPAYYLQNLTQPFMLSMPSVAGKHGYDKTFVEFSKAYKEVFQLINKEGLSEETYAKLPADVRDAIETLVNSGRIDISLDQDLGRWRDNEGSKTELAGKVIEKLRGVAQNIESFNRVATAVAAYRLEKASGASKEQAIDYANQIILDTHGDYSGFNAPRITRQGLGRLATQFRKFQLIQISLIAKLVKQSFAGASREEKMVARRALGFTLGHTLAAGGLMGFPGFAAIAWVVGAAFGDEDEPDNPELTLRRMIGNKELSDVLLKGVPKLAGVDLSGKLGMGQMLSVLPYTDVDLSKAGIAQAGYALLTGPTGSLVQRAGEGLGLMADGEYYKGLEKFMPGVVAQSMKAARFGLMEGITLKNGDVVMKPDEISFLDMLSVAIGLPSNKITDRQFVQGVAIETDKFYKEKTGEIKRDYVKAVKEKDTAGMAKARQEWVELQNAKARQKLQRQPLSDLMKAPQEQKKRERNVESGVPATKSNKQFIKEVSKI